MTTQLSTLLNSTANEYSQLNDREFVEIKVKKLVVMSGGYSTGHSWNLWVSNPPFTVHVINTWDRKLTFVGDSVGIYVLSAGPLMASNLEIDPIRMGYIFYGYGKPLSSWDPFTILYVTHGLGELIERGNECGFNRILANGSNEWYTTRRRKNNISFS